MKRISWFVAIAVVLVLTPIAVVFSAPQAAWVKYIGNPVMSPGDGWDSGNVFAAKVLLDNGVYRMWYAGNSVSESRTRIGYATSPDGTNWTRENNSLPVLSYAGGGFWEAKGVSAPSVLYNAPKWEMWYAGTDATGRYSIGYASSPDGITWTKYAGNPVLSPSDSGADDASVVSPHVLYKDGIYHMWYAGRGDNNQIFYATSSDGKQWTKYAGNPVLQLGGDYQWDNGEIAAPSVIWTGARFEMWYQGYSRGTLQRYIGHAVSSDGMAWSKDDLNPVVGLEPGAWDANSVAYPSVGFSPSGQAMLWYQGEAGAGANKKLGVVYFDLNAVPTPRPTFPNEPPVDDGTPTPEISPIATQAPVATWTPIPVRCGQGQDCILLPAISK